jgi:hypothetical protein
MEWLHRKTRAASKCVNSLEEVPVAGAIGAITRAIRALARVSLSPRPWQGTAIPWIGARQG